MEQDHPLRYDVDDQPPLGLSTLLACQTVLLSITGIILTPVIVLRGAGMDLAAAPAVIFYALVISGITTVLQARKVWRFGAGYILLMGTSGAFIAVGITALAKGGMPLMMTLITLSALVQFFFANHLGALRRFITPLVGGIAIMLIAVTVMPIVFQHFPAQAGDGPALPLISLLTLGAIILLSFYGGRQVKLWAPSMGVGIGTFAAWCLGEWDLSQVQRAAWFGFPELSWTGFDLSFGQDFWLLLPAFVIITIVGAIETYGDAIAVQQISHKKARPADFRAVQGALYADGLGNLLSGLLGTVPNTTYSTSISVVDMTGVAARRVGIFCGIIILVLAFFPKVTALILSIPQPVVGAYLLVLILLLFIHGLKLVLQQGLSFENSMIMGLGFWLGTGFQQQAVFHALIPTPLLPVLDNGMTAGTLVTLILSGLLNLNPGKKTVFKTHLAIESLPGIRDVILKFTKKNHWTGHIRDKITLAVEETLLSLIQAHPDRQGTDAALRLELRRTDRHIEIDMAVSSLPENMELLIDAARTADTLVEDQLSLKILGSLVTEFRHAQFHGLDFVTMKISTGSQVNPGPQP